MGYNTEFFIGLPLAISIFTAILNDGFQLSMFVTIASLAVAIAGVAALQALSGVSGEFLGFGVQLPDIKDFSLKMTFVSVFLTGLYTGNVLIGLNLILDMPYSLGLIIFGVLTTLYVFGIFAMLGDE